MSTDFSRTLSLLRQEKGMNQRTVAAGLGISQALLSHYETGAREPKLEFLLKLCDYYGVSCDFLLGRTMVRGGAELNMETIDDANSAKDNRLAGRSASALLGKKLIVNAISILFDLAGRGGNKEVIGALTAFFSGAVYKVYRHFYAVAGDNPESFFSVEAVSYGAAAAADMALSEEKLLRALHEGGKHALAPMSNGSLNEQFPLYIQSLLTVLHQAGDRMAKRGKA